MKQWQSVGCSRMHMAMTSRALTLLVLSGLASSPAALKAAATSALQQDLAVSLNERPVMKVVRMLEDMEAELTKEMEDDKAVMSELTCWCETNEAEKTKALELGSAKSKALSAKIDEYAGKIAELKAKRASTLEDLNKDIAALEQARELRMQESKEFQESETGLLDAVAAAQNAIVALSKHHDAGFAQLRSAAHILLNSHTTKLAKPLSKENAAVLDSFLHGAEAGTAFLSIPGYKSFAPQSGQIFGILKQMKEDFESSLSEEQKAEQKARQEFEALKAAKNAEISQGKVMMTSIDAELADFGEKKADAEKELADTDAQFALDTEFLKNLKIKCSTTEAEFDARMKDRMTEIAAVEDTIKLLNSDETFDAFEKMAASASFLQTSASSNQEEQKLRHRAVSVLQRAADRVGKPQLALIAASVQLDEFTKVKALIDDLVKELEKQQKEEAVQKDVCNKDFFTNKQATAAAYDKKESLLAKEADLTKTIEGLTKDIKTATEENVELMKQMKMASETREAQNADFQTTISDHRVMAIILQKALDRMKQVYLLLQERQEPGAPHIETSATHTDPGNAPAKFTKYETNAGGGRVVKALETILADVTTTETEAIVTEGDAQAAYESFMKDSNKGVLQTSAALTHMKGTLAKSKEELISTKEDLKQTVDTLEDLSKENGDLHAMCDYLLNNFDVRQAARTAEMEALAEAKAILSGSQ
mmetsp:Transcript_120639/g.196291  ORF Transcript_120639/g.196291 Transcript_120639/m.196291 type:complete len:709 (-) Transcript_120639:69-2195(-)